MSQENLRTVPASSLYSDSTVFILDDDPDVRRTVSLLVRSVHLNPEPHATPGEFLESLDPDRPGCLVLDMRMPGMSGLELQQELADRDVRLPIIFITAHGEIPNATAAMRAGAVDFLAKPYSPQMLLERIHEALAIDCNQRQADAQRRVLDDRIATLTTREREVMQRLASGEATKVIASKLGISTKTVDNHRAKILDKMGVDNATQLARLIAPVNAISQAGQ